MSERGVREYLSSPQGQLLLVAGAVSAAALGLVLIVARSALEGPTLPAPQQPIRAAPPIRVEGRRAEGAPARGTAQAHPPSSAEALAPPEVPADLVLTPSLSPGVLPEADGAAEALPALSSAEPRPPPKAAVPPATAAASASGPSEAQALRADRVVVRLHSAPAGLDVRVDGRMRGRTPVKLMLNPGTYALTVGTGAGQHDQQLIAAAEARLCFARGPGEAVAPADCAALRGAQPPSGTSTTSGSSAPSTSR